MADFVCEERVSSRAPAMYPDGFVAEMRPSTRRALSSRSQLVDVETALKITYPQVHYDKQNEQSLVKLLSNKSKREYTDILTTSIIKLVQTLLTGHDIAVIEGSLQVSFHGVELPIQVKLNESLCPGKNGYHLDLEKDIGIDCRGDRSPSIEPNWDGYHCQYRNHFSPDLVNRDEFSSVASSPPRTESMTTEYISDQMISTLSQEEAIYLSTRNLSQPKSQERLLATSSDSGEESGYKSTYSSRSEGAEVYKYNSALTNETPNAEKRIQGYVYGPKVSTVESPDLENGECPLIIDVNKSQGDDSQETTTNEEHRSDETDSDDHIRPLNKIRTKEYVSSSSSSSDDSEHNLPSTCSDDTDSDVPMDLSGDCKIEVDSESVSAEQVDTVESCLAVQRFECKSCSQTFSDVNSLSKHALRSHQVYTCHHCRRVFTAKNNLKRHTRIHTGLKPYKCSQCSNTFARRDDLKGHQLRHDYSKPFRCSLCKKGYTDRACVKNHMVKEHGSRLMYVCPQCGESFDREDAFSGHKKTHLELIPYACNICPFIGSNNLMACKHSLLHTHKLFSCKPCNAYFADPFGYTDHIKKHKKNESFTNYVCCFCDITLPTYEQFVRHEYTHAHGKTHTCLTCNKQFRSKALLQEHAQSHDESPNATSGEKQICQIVSPDNSDIVVIPPNEEHSSQRSKKESTEKPKAEDMNIQEEVLDLTIKKQVISDKSSPCTPNDQSFSNGQEKILNFDGPRNGSVTKFSCPREENCTLRYIAELPSGIVSKDVERSNEADFKAAWNNKERQRESVESMTDSRQISAVNNQLENLITSNTSPCENTMPSSKIRTPSHQFEVRGRYTPYQLPLKAAELASKFILARGQSPFVTGSAMKDINKGFRSLMPQHKEVVIQKDLCGKPSILFVPRQIQSNQPYPTQGRDDGKENACLNTLHLIGNGNELEQASSVVYGLTGKEYRKEGSISPAHDQARRTSTISFPFIKTEPVEHKSPSLEPLPTDNIPESVSSVTSGTSPQGDNSHTCDTCAQNFETFSQLESHSVLTHKRYMCEYCGKGFTSRPNRDRHVRYHTGERPYKCDLCDTAFHRGDDLKYHRTTRHPEATPFVCARCSASFTWKRDLDRHIRHSKCKN